GLRQELDGAPAHGVPFSGELGGTACSPGESTPLLPRAWGSSWRQWVTNFLAAAMVTAAGDRPGSDAGDAALWRVLSSKASTLGPLLPRSVGREP
ncbi:MAG TPA: hypothetical protein VFY87_09135, partial [Geminicoccaceae bacterium]|nr:hypothetical protein [Geminicoccaceae bacterium]